MTTPPATLGATKPKGWFSRRHKSPDAHLAARAKYLSEHGPAARRRSAAEREWIARANADAAAQRIADLVARRRSAAERGAA